MAKKTKAVKPNLDNAVEFINNIQAEHSTEDVELAGIEENTEPFSEDTEIVSSNFDAEIEVPKSVAKAQIPTKKVIFKCIHSGGYKIPIIVRNKFREEVKRYITFKNNTYMTDDAQEIEKLTEIMETETENLVPIKNRKVLSEDEFIAHTTPEKLYLEIDGEMIHISDLRTAYRFAKENGVKFTAKDKVILAKPVSKISRGGASAGM